jgi:glycosyltransferase involved in cell wall biosynthesis
MRILNVVTGDEGGGGRAAYRLNRGLRQIGCDARMYVASKFHDDSSTVVFHPTAHFGAKLERFARRMRLRMLMRGTKVLGMWTLDHLCQRGSAPLRQFPPADIINLHHVANFFDYAAYFRKVAPKAKTVWTLHLMSPFTGGCVYSFGCNRFENSCGYCPMIAPNKEHDLSRKIWEDKSAALAAIASDQLRLVAPSQWLAGEARKSSLFRRFPTTVIPYGIDTDAYAPRDRAFSRKTLGVSEDAAVVLFVTQHTVHSRAKGFADLVQALAGLGSNEGIHLLTLGAVGPPQLPFPHTHLGHVFNDRILSMVYSAADVFAVPSRQDNLPNVVLESFACGTPVVGFDTGGMPDMVRPGLTGQLVPVGNVEALREALISLLHNPGLRERLSENCRRIALEEYSLERQAREYLKLYETF